MGLFTYNLCINLIDDEKFCDDHDVGPISTTHDDIEDNDDDAGDDDSEDDSNDAIFSNRDRRRTNDSGRNSFK